MHPRRRENPENFNHNVYATKKTVAQGMLDIALLASNASQLKYVLQTGAHHEFYTVLIALISTSIILQLMIGLIFVVLGSVNLNKVTERSVALALNDMVVVFVFVITVPENFNQNVYATKKTVAQGMLDIALLASNASQLKYVLQTGAHHEFYTTLIALISISIILQVAMGIVHLSLNLFRDMRLHDPRSHRSAMIINHVSTITTVILTAVNFITAALDTSLAQYVKLSTQSKQKLKES